MTSPPVPAARGGRYPIAVEAGTRYALTVAASGAAGSVVVEQLSANGGVVGSTTLSPTIAGGGFETISSTLTPTDGVAAVWIVLAGGLLGTTVVDGVRLTEQ